MPDGSPALLFGLLPVLVAQSFGLYNDIRKVSYVAVFIIIIFFDSIYTLMDDFVLLLPLFSLMMIAVVAYGLLFYRQVQARLRTQTFLRDLEAAHKKVEELTLANERQRMARDLHDTLAQGLAGLSMQLQAADAHLTKGNPERAQEIVRKSMGQARRTLADARRAIDDLRETSAADVDLKEAVSEEVRHFIDATGIPVETEFDVTTKRLRKVMTEHVLHILKECLTNVARHAKADRIWIELSDRNGRFEMEVRDNGVGFQHELIGKQIGHYGLLGIRERVRLFDGHFELSNAQPGTIIRIQAPLREEESH
jgi:NarL family two-component system sensor histidine kinase YdfH